MTTAGKKNELANSPSHAGCSRTTTPLARLQRPGQLEARVLRVRVGGLPGVGEEAEPERDLLGLDGVGDGGDGDVGGARDAVAALLVQVRAHQLVAAKLGVLPVGAVGALQGKRDEQTLFSDLRRANTNKGNKKNKKKQQPKKKMQQQQQQQLQLEQQQQQWQKRAAAATKTAVAVTAAKRQQNIAATITEAATIPAAATTSSRGHYYY